MKSARAMIESHPDRPQSEADALIDCLQACFECEQTCTACADACLHEQNPAALRFCIRTDLDCADICATMGRMLSRASRPESRTMRAMLEACATACRGCGEECAQHEQKHGHCRICAEACRTCADACERLLKMTP